MPRRAVYCSGGLYVVQGGYMDVQEGCILFRGLKCCSGGLYGYSGGLHVEENDYVYSGH